jgi:foldase protein PrsA
MEQDINNPREEAVTRGERTWKILSIVLLAALIGAIVFPFLNNDEAEVVAIVNGTDITKEQFYAEMVRAGGEQTLDFMIEDQLISQEAEKANIEVTEADIDAELATVKASFGSEEMFQQALMQYGMTEEDLKEDMEKQVTLRKLLEPSVTITDEEIAAYYEENKDFFAEEEMVRASHILVETREEAEALLEQIKGGADFATLASEHSLDPGSKENGGDLDYFPRGVMHEPFEEAAFNLAIGEVSGVVETSEGFHIIKVTDRKEATTPSLEEKKEEIRTQLLNEEITTLAQTWLEETKAAAEIEKFLNEK